MSGSGKRVRGPIVAARVSVEERDVIRLAAAACKVTVSTYLRESALLRATAQTSAGGSS